MPPKAKLTSASTTTARTTSVSSASSLTNSNTKSKNKRSASADDTVVVEEHTAGSTRTKKTAKKIKVADPVEEESDEEEEDAPVITKQKKKAAPATTGKAPKTLREKILHLLAHEDTLISLIKLKKRLTEAPYNIEENTTNNNKINKLLKTLQEEEGHADYFGKIGGSYHGGTNSPAYQTWRKEEDQRLAKEADDKAHADDINCPFCDKWNDVMKTFKGEDSIARGGRFVCQFCKKTFWSWISDGYRYGHEVEYKKSKMFF